MMISSSAGPVLLFAMAESRLFVGPALEESDEDVSD